MTLKHIPLPLLKIHVVLISLGLTTRSPTELNTVFSYVSTILSYVKRKASHDVELIRTEFNPFAFLVTLYLIFWQYTPFLFRIFWPFFSLAFTMFCYLLVVVTLLVVLLSKKREECPICCEDVNSIQVISSGCAEGCRACISCCERYLSTDEVESISRMRRACAFNIRCFGGCGGRLRQVVAYAYGTEAHRCCINALEARTRLIQNVPANSSWVECTVMSCVGVAYTGNENLMCFLCETQWPDPNYGIKRKFFSFMKKVFWPERIDGVSGWRPCPHCGAAIIKNGGCPNMRCGICDGVFYWGSFSNSIHNVVERDAPPSRRTANR